MQGVDIGIIVLLVIPAIVGVLYGFLNIVFSLAAWVAASIVAARFGGDVAPLLAGLTDAAILQKILAFIAVFIVSLLILTGIGYFALKLLGRTGLTGADRILGLFFGLGLGGAIVAVIVFLAGFTALPREQWWQDSVMIRPFQTIAVWGHRYLPEEMAEHHGFDTGEDEGIGLPGESV